MHFPMSIPYWEGHTVMSSLSPPHTIPISPQVLRTLVRSSIVLRRLQFRHNGVLFKDFTSLVQVTVNEIIVGQNSFGKPVKVYGLQ